MKPSKILMRNVLDSNKKTDVNNLPTNCAICKISGKMIRV